MNFFELLLALLSIIIFLFSLLMLFFRNNGTILRAMFIPSIFLEDRAIALSVRLSEPINKAVGITGSGQSGNEMRLKKNFLIRFGLMLFLTSCALMYFAIT
ncbi:MAG: hypothetical protein G01um101448_9 [Parcubacteria group bacterium Gr01-1014_48]|nr:MAG: hypothetical protein Greene041614_371 [Parcubacteria group bacterium Greene0416_14]TSC74594.1 MAG: hypothetical protein G01um101448_9 [Parcubacteria group bacterium Gr01-1014_48]TSD01607.1 MAG: hypothetical protein Greene101415_187 [Parcubacteria group bacterium Greene1014_15]TSD08344.1 MAG: hypothetical protein Greene07144_139 [Parcubacteria group bacterium Greene0714_4]